MLILVIIMLCEHNTDKKVTDRAV